jgi:hypothetical protein
MTRIVRIEIETSTSRRPVFPVAEPASGPIISALHSESIG